MPYTTPNPSDPWPLQVMDRLRGLLSVNETLTGLYQGEIEQFPAMDAPEKDEDGNRLPPLVTLHAARFTGIAHQTMGQAGSEGGRQGNILPIVITMNLHLSQQTDRAIMDEAYRTLWKTASAFQRAVSAYPSDPGPRTQEMPRQLWRPLKFASPTIEILHEPGTLLRAVLRFTLDGQTARPERPAGVPFLP